MLLNDGVDSDQTQAIAVTGILGGDDSACSTLDPLKERIGVPELLLINNVNSRKGLSRPPEGLLVKRVVVGGQDDNRSVSFIGTDGSGNSYLSTITGNVVAIDLADIKCVFFVREFADTDSLSRKTFTTRPRAEGLWVRIKFKDGEILEGLMPNDLSLNTPEGFLINPPDLRSNVQRLFVPRTALESLTVLAVIGATRRQRRGAEDVRQVPMFGE